MIEKIQKRNGQMVAFDSMKILNAISRANMAVEDEVMEPADLSYLTQKVCSQLNPDEVVTVEHVQDVVEETLIRLILRKLPRLIFSIARSIQRFVRRNLISWIFTLS